LPSLALDRYRNRIITEIAVGRREQERRGAEQKGRGGAPDLQREA